MNPIDRFLFFVFLNYPNLGPILLLLFFLIFKHFTTFVWISIQPPLNSKILSLTRKKAQVPRAFHFIIKHESWRGFSTGSITFHLSCGSRSISLYPKLISGLSHGPYQKKTEGHRFCVSTYGPNPNLME